MTNYLKGIGVLILLVGVLAGSFLSGEVLAQNPDIKQVTIVNPIRGNDFWTHPYSILQTPKKQYELIAQNNLNATWLVRYDALTLSEVVGFLKLLNPNQEVGIFLEITPKLTQDAGVLYNQSQSWHYAKSVLVTGYTIEDRKKLIDTAFKKYQEVFNRKPLSVGAWWIDADSLNYLKDKYGVIANLDVSDQFSTDGYQVWGQYWSSPFYPSKVNALMPAQSEESKIGIVTTQWAMRDPFNGYGVGTFESTYSVQANDYLRHNLDSKYFEKLLNIYPQLNIGLENDFDWSKFGSEYQNQIQILSDFINKKAVSVKTMAEYAQYYKKQNPKISPNLLIDGEDPLNSGGRVIWYQTPKYRVGWFYDQRGSVIRDLRLLNDSLPEECLKKSCDSLKLAFSQNQAIDEVNYGTKWIIDEGRISDIKVNQTSNGAVIKYKLGDVNNQKKERTIEFLENDIKVDDQIKTIPVRIMEAVNETKVKKTDTGNFVSEINIPNTIRSLFLSGFKFLMLTVLFFFLPGFVLTKRYSLSIPVGLTIFTLAAFVLGVFKVEFLIWLMPIFSAFFVWKDKALSFSKIKIDSYFLISWLVIILGSLSWLVTTFKNGLEFNYGWGFWGPNGHDAIWHLSLISELQKNIPPNNPVFFGEKLINYHYFFDLLLARSGSLFNIQALDLLFRWFPVLIAVLSGVLVVKVTEKICLERLGLSEVKAKVSSIAAAFFVYFGGSFGWVVNFLRHGDFSGESMFWSQQSISTLLNPPFAISIPILLSGLIIFYEIERKSKNWQLTLALIICWGSLVEFKVYGGLLVLGSLGLITLEKLLFKKDFNFLLTVYLPILILSLLVFLPNNIGSNSLIIFSPLWLINSMIIFEDRLGWYRLSLALQSGGAYKVITSLGLGVLIFLVGNLGSRIVALVNFKVWGKERFLSYLILLGLIIPLLFIQKGTNWNIIQFFYYSLLVLNIFAGIGVGLLFSRKKMVLSVLFLIGCFLLTIPTTLNTFNQYLPSRPPAKLSANEIDALSFLKNQPQGTVLSLPYEQNLKFGFLEPLPLSVYESTAYVSAFSSQQSFLEDRINLEILGIDYKTRLNIAKDILKVNDWSKVLLRENNISYLYLLKKQINDIDEGKLGIKKIFENDEVAIYQKV